MPSKQEGASQRCYELIQSPRAPLGRSLWKSKDKLFCYCQGFDNEFPVWSLSLNNEKELEWKVEGCKEFEMLNEDLSKEFASGLTQATKGPKPRWVYDNRFQARIQSDLFVETRFNYKI